MSALSADQIVTMTEILVVLMGIGIIWLVYRGSENAELPGDAPTPSPAGVDDTIADSRGRTL